MTLKKYKEFKVGDIEFKDDDMISISIDKPHHGAFITMHGCDKTELFREVVTVIDALEKMKQELDKL